MPPPVPTPEMEIGQLSAELVSLHRHLRALADRWNDRARTAGDETARCAGELHDVLDCTPTYFPDDFGRPVPRSSRGAVLVGLSAEEATANLSSYSAARAVTRRPTVAEPDIAAFLRARLDEREAVALAAQGTTEGRWEQDDPVHAHGLIVDDYGDTVTYDEGAPSEAQAVHIADNDPEFVLADVAAKRQIVEQYELADGGMTGQILRNCLDTPIRLLALPYAGHPDYREEWKP